MANRHWVGGTETWNHIAGSKWALTSGGVGGEAIPTSSDDVFFDAASGSVTVSTDGRPCNNLDFSGFTGTFSGTSGNTISGNLVLGSGMNLTNTGIIIFASTSTGKTITSNGISIKGPVRFDGVGGGWTLTDDFVLTTTNAPAFELRRGAFDAGGFNVTCASFNSSNINVRGLTLGSGTWTMTNSWNIAAITNLTFDGGTGMISWSVAGTFTSGAITYNHLSITGNAIINSVIVGNCRFTTLSIDFTSNASAGLVQGSSNTITVANLIILNNTQKRSRFANIAMVLTGTTNIQNVSLVDVTATGSATPVYLSSGNQDLGGNSGFIFSSANEPTSGSATSSNPSIGIRRRSVAY